MNNAQQQDVVDALDLLYGITDVYWHKGVLYVVNDYDIDHIRDYLEVSPYLFAVQAVSDDVFA